MEREEQQFNGDARRQIIERIHRWGNSVAEALLDPACQIFSQSGIDGLIGYYTNGKCAVVFGDPVCSREDRPHLVEAFHQFCEKQKKNIIYLVVSKDFAQWMHVEKRGAILEFGEELFLDPRCDPRTKSGKKGILLRGKVRQAVREGVSVLEYCNDAPHIEQTLNEIATQWLDHRRGPQIYISRIRLFEERFGKRWFYAKQGEKLIGALVLNQLQAREGWVLDRVMTLPDAPHGTSELMVVTILEYLAKEGCPFITFGPNPSDLIGEMQGFGKYTTFFARKFYKTCRKLFNLDGKRKYWEKFHPTSAPAFIVFKKPRLGIHEIRGLMHALNVSKK